MNTKIILISCTSFLILVLLAAFFPVNGEEEIYDNMIRLHVLANSDSKEDQELKLKVRDAVLSEAEELNASDPKSAYDKTEASISRLEEIAKSVVKEAGYDYDVTVTLGKEKYPEREYEGFTLPQGTYRSLRVLIGAAEGQNWWCVLYPPLCTSCAEEREEVFIAAGFTENQYEAITQSENKTYKVKFKIVEIIKGLFD